MLRRFVLAAMALGLAAPASAMQPAPSIVRSPSVAAAGPQAAPAVHWERLPTSEDIFRLFPRQAMNWNLSGHAVMRCKVGTDGTLTACAIIQEDPWGFGFGEATLAAARFFKMASTTVDGKSVEGGTVQIPLNWQSAWSDAAPENVPSTPPDSLFPVAAKAKNVGGVTQMICIARPDGKLHECAIASECPAGLGFGEAARKSAPYFKVRPNRVARKVIIPMTWKIEGVEPPAECLPPPAGSKP